MSAALSMPVIWASANLGADLRINPISQPSPDPAEILEPVLDEPLPEISLAFYRKHTMKTLRRYLYASMLVGRAPAILGEPVDRGWVSNRRVKTFEDAVIFVLDIERCLDKLGKFDRALLSRIVLQEYTYAETATLLGMSSRTVSTKYPIALDRLTELLLADGLLILPQS